MCVDWVAEWRGMRKRQQVHRKKKDRSRSTAKAQKQHHCFCRIGGRWGAEIAAFFVVLKYRDPSRKKFFKGLSEKIFFLTQSSRNSRLSPTRFA